ncbi:hypothetical protein [Paenibacillus contaminans]|nr:hypothetical protein [Paenibacillus contaminans]
MPYYYFKEIWTPLKLLGISIFKDEEDRIWYKLWKYKRRQL